MNYAWPIKPGSTTAGSRTIVAQSATAASLLQVQLEPDCAPRAWAVTLASDGVHPGRFLVRAGDNFGSVDFVVPFALGTRFAEITVGGQSVFVQFVPNGTHPRDYAVGATVGLFAT